MEILAVSGDTIFIVVATIAASILLIISSCIGAMSWIIYQQGKENAQTRIVIKSLCSYAKKNRYKIKELEEELAKVQESHKNVRDEELSRDQNYGNRIEQNLRLIKEIDPIEVLLAKIKELMKVSNNESVEDVKFSHRDSQKSIKKAK